MHTRITRKKKVNKKTINSVNKSGFVCLKINSYEWSTIIKSVDMLECLIQFFFSLYEHNINDVIVQMRKDFYRFSEKKPLWKPGGFDFSLDSNNEMTLTKTPAANGNFGLHIKRKNSEICCVLCATFVFLTIVFMTMKTRMFEVYFGENKSSKLFQK